MSFDGEDWKFESSEEDIDPNSIAGDFTITNPEIRYKVWCFGKNKEGELAQKHNRNLFSPEPLKQMGEKTTLQCISSGRNHSAAVTKNGYLYLCGSTLHGKLGIDKKVTCLMQFSLFPLSKTRKVKQVACGDYHTLCLLEEGKVLGWGGTLHKVIIFLIIEIRK